MADEAWEAEVGETQQLWQLSFSTWRLNTHLLHYYTASFLSLVIVIVSARDPFWFLFTWLRFIIIIIIILNKMNAKWTYYVFFGNGAIHRELNVSELRINIKQCISNRSVHVTVMLICLFSRTTCNCVYTLSIGFSYVLSNRYGWNLKCNSFASNVVVT